MVLLIFTSYHSHANKKYDSAILELNQVVKDFGAAIIEKDEQKFVNLFYSNSIPWLGVNAQAKKGKVPATTD